jgi:hypothetical protein
LERLPRHSHFHASVMEDGDSVTELLKRSGAGPTTFGLLDWTYERELLTLIVDILNQTHATLVQAHSDDGKRPSVEMMKRPVTILNKVEAQQGLIEHQERVRKFLPRG